MPLSEHEQQQLDQIERALYAEDPKFASNVRGRKMHRPSRRRRIQGVVLAIVGLGLLVGGLLVLWRPAGVPVISVIGFLVMFAGVVLTLASLRGDADESESEGGGKADDKGKSKNSLSQRMEDRLRKRFDH